MAGVLEHGKDAIETVANIEMTMENGKLTQRKHPTHPLNIVLQELIPRMVVEWRQLLFRKII